VGTASSDGNVVTVSIRVPPSCGSNVKRMRIVGMSGTGVRRRAVGDEIHAPDIIPRNRGPALLAVDRCRVSPRPLAWKRQALHRRLGTRCCQRRRRIQNASGRTDRESSRHLHSISRNVDRMLEPQCISEADDTGRVPTATQNRAFANASSDLEKLHNVQNGLRMHVLRGGALATIPSTRR
jgi:hypothetical protein